MLPRAAPWWASLGFALLVSACAPAAGVDPAGPTVTVPSTTTTTTLGIPAGGGDGDDGTVVVGIGAAGAPRTLNPFLDGPDTALLDLIAPAFMATGYTIDPETLEAVPDLLEEIPSLGNGGIVAQRDGTMAVTVRVVEGATWADGVPITGDDLAFTVEVATDPGLPIRSDLRERYGRIVPGSLEAVGRELRFRMEPGFAVEHLFGIVLPRHAVEGRDFATAFTETTWVAGGPFRFASYQPGQYLELRRNPAYDRGEVALERVVFRFFATAEGADPRLLRAFQTRLLDVALIPDAHVDAAPFRELEPEGARVATVAGPTWELLTFQFGPANRNPESRNQWLEYRRAVAHAVDRSRLAEDRGTAPLASPIAMSVPALADGNWDYPPDPAEVDADLFRLGERLDEDLFAGDGPRLVLTTSSASPATVAAAGEVVVMLREAGFGAELQLEDSALFYGGTLDAGTWDTAVWRLTATPGREGAVRFASLFDPEGLPFAGANFSRWGTVGSSVEGDPAAAEYAALVDDLVATVDPDEADRLLRRAEAILSEQVVALPLVVSEEVGVAWWGDEVAGIVPHPVAGGAWNVGEWRRVEP